MAIDKFLRAIYKGEKIYKYGNGESSRDYTYIDDVIEGIISSLEEGKKGSKIYNLGGSDNITLNNFIKLCEKIVGKKALIENKEDQLGDVPHTFADISKAKKELDFNPKNNLETGLLKTFKYIKNET